VVAGAVGGLAAAWVMNQFLAGSAKLEERVQKKLHPEQQTPSEQSGGEDSTVKTAKAISRLVGHELSEREKKVAGPVVHYAFGASMGALYGLLSEIQPHARIGFGTVFGAALWLAADGFVVPALKLAPKPTETPVKSHVNHIAAHVVYGAATEAVRLGLNAAIDHDWRDTAEDVDEYVRDGWPVKYVVRNVA